jgi:hypothetical protein
VGRGHSLSTGPAGCSGHGARDAQGTQGTRSGAPSAPAAPGGWGQLVGVGALLLSWWRGPLAGIDGPMPDDLSQLPRLTEVNLEYTQVGAVAAACSSIQSQHHVCNHGHGHSHSHSRRVCATAPATARPPPSCIRSRQAQAREACALLAAGVRHSA